MLSYQFFLDSGYTWSFCAAPDAEPWLRKLASIFSLKKDLKKSRQGIVFTRKKPLEQGRLIKPVIYRELLRLNLPKTGWKEENLKAIRFFTHSKTKIFLASLGKILNKEMEIIRMWQALHPVYDRILDTGGLSLHAALLEKEGKGIILAASGATGKSTCARRVPRPWKALSDDEAVLVKNGRHFNAHPFPTWSQYLQNRSKKTWDVSKKVRLCGIFFLRQATKDQVEPVGQGHTTAFLTQSAAQAMNRIWMLRDERKKSRYRKKCFSNACQIASSVPAFILHVSLTGRFWEKIDDVLK